MKENKEFERQNISMSRPPLDSAPFGTKTPDPKTLTLPMESPKCKEKPREEYVTEDQDSDPSSSDSLWSDSDMSNDRNYKCRRCDKNKRTGITRNKTL